MKRHRRRRFIKVVGLLLLGAALNVAVAWGCVITLPSGAESFHHSKLTQQDIALIEGRGKCPATDGGASQWNWRTVRSRVMFLERPDWIVVIEDEGIEVDLPYEPCVLQLIAGWPMKSLSGEIWADYAANAGQRLKSDIDLSWMSPVPSRPTESFDLRNRVPLRPLFPGFAINTLFYAAVCWVMFSAPFVLRRMIRRRRGLCPACAYPVGSSDVCTECGQALKPV